MLTVREDGRITVNNKFVIGKLNIYLPMNQHFSWESIFVVFVGNFISPQTYYKDLCESYQMFNKLNQLQTKIYCHEPVNFCLYTNINSCEFI